MRGDAGTLVKPVVWLGDSLRELKTFPKADIELITRRLKQAIEISRKKG